MVYHDWDGWAFGMDGCKQEIPWSLVSYSGGVCVYLLSTTYVTKCLCISPLDYLCKEVSVSISSRLPTYLRV